ncbi:uncharacterized protein LOC112090253 [Morus notabilis]|uniref:uncharacterized protein LOC112090253 n=1 Tax=Morus notabilis TaxID=981085 RepID=UPI000CED0F57|nr:uncharacterized protein LOC112090253 [Morus notabilis]
MATQEAARINDPSRLMAARKATAPANTFKSRVLTQGSHRLKAAEPSTFLSGAAVSSNLYPLMTGDQKQLMQAYAVAPGGSPAPCDQKQINGSLHDLKSAKKCKEGSGNEIVGDSRLRNTGDVTSPSGSTGIKDSVAETARANQDSSAKFYKRKYFSAKPQRLDSTPLHAAVAQSGETLNDHGVNTDMLLRDSETNTVETKNLGSTLSRHGTKSIITKEKLEEKKEKKKKSKRESAARAKLRKQHLNKYRDMIAYISWFRSGTSLTVG